MPRTSLYRHAMRFQCVLVLVVSSVFALALKAQEVGSYQPMSPDRRGLSSKGWAPPSKAAKPGNGEVRNTFVLGNDKVFPHLAQGAGWQTILVLVNLGSTTVTFDQYFYSQLGQPRSVTFKTIPEGIVVAAEATSGTMPPGGSLNILLFDTGGPVQIVWSALGYDSTSSRIGGYAIFRQSIQGSVDFEALVPLSASDDYTFVMPFDNLENFVTSMAILNPGSAETSVRATVRDLDGKSIGTYSIVLPAGNQLAFEVPTQFPVTANQVGTILIEGSTFSLSGLGFRFNPGHAFATIPILNWQGMFD